MAKYTLVFIAIFCVALQVTFASSVVREKREGEAEASNDKPLTVDGIMSWFGELGQNLQDFTDKHITDERKEVVL